MHKNSRQVLVVDDEPKILEVVCMLLESKGFVVFPAENGKKALEIFDSENISLVILDLMLPDVSGEEVCTIIRKKSRVPVIMLTARVEEEDVVSGLELGADDYIMKPFGLKELYARVEAVLRRTESDLIPLVKRNSWRAGDLVVDFERNEIKKKGISMALTPSEMKILSALIKYPGKVFTRDELIDSALGEDFAGYDRAIDSHIKNIRKKIEDDPRNPAYVLTIPGLGYKFGG
ncbi:response regulator transcription factor [Clostridium boliviensis]|uniref:Stage 0 sporulation protein A homolog n=1 Tax=Clostridium boliviensis TaxID=318465 RepID=A0ABU4GK14_9CLOT|nr:response regulator transcription factor [Clostridium boliviensis]MDW2797948.1 response regulator transcription factor [Clostridium boliviensis]